MAGDVEACLAAGLHIQVFGDATGDVGRPSHGATGMGQGLGQVQHVHARPTGQFAEGNQLEPRVSSGRRSSRASTAHARPSESDGTWHSGPGRSQANSPLGKRSRTRSAVEGPTRTSAIGSCSICLLHRADANEAGHRVAGRCPVLWSVTHQASRVRSITLAARGNAQTVPPTHASAGGPKGQRIR